MVTMERDVEQGNKCSHVKSQCISSFNTLIERTRYYIPPIVHHQLISNGDYFLMEIITCFIFIPFSHQTGWTAIITRCLDKLSASYVPTGRSNK